MSPISPQLVQDVLHIAQQAGQYLAQFYAKSVQVEIKADNTPVTEADLFVSQFLSQQLSALTPDIPILSEESAHIPLAERQQWQRYWLIDPLDGTQQFLNRTDQFSVLIALVENHRPVFGIIHAPILARTYYAMAGGGAYKIEKGQTHPLAKRKLDLSQPLKVVLGAKGSMKKAQTILNPELDYQFRFYGSSGLKAALVAEGVHDFYLRQGNTGEWDTAAAEVLLAETGGMICDLEFQLLTYNQRESLTNPHFVVWADCQQDVRLLFKLD